MAYVKINGIRIDGIVAKQLDKIVNDVLNKDKDKHFIIDGRERSGKSKFGRQLAKVLDPTFNIDRIAFNSSDFMGMVRSPESVRGYT